MTGQAFCLQAALSAILLMLILPGSIFLLLYRFTARLPNGKFTISVEVVVGSYILNLIVQVLFGEIENGVQADMLLLVVSACLGFLAGWLRTRPRVEKCVGEIFGVRIEDSVWEAIADMEQGCFVNVFLDQEQLMYKGAYRRYFPKDGETWIELQEYSVQRTRDHVCLAEESIYTHKGSPQHMVVINIKDITRIEILYAKDSNKL